MDGGYSAPRPRTHNLGRNRICHLLLKRLLFLRVKFSPEPSRVVNRMKEPEEMVGASSPGKGTSIRPLQRLFARAIAHPTRSVDCSFVLLFPALLASPLFEWALIIVAGSDALKQRVILFLFFDDHSFWLSFYAVGLMLPSVWVRNLRAARGGGLQRGQQSS